MMMRTSSVVVVSSFLALLLSVVVVSAQTKTGGGVASLYEAMNDCSSLETELIEQVRALGVDSKNKLFDTIERLQSRNSGSKQCTNSEWRLNYGHLSYYKIGDGTSEGPGCTDLPYVRTPWPYDTNNKGVDSTNYPEAVITEGTCSGFVLQCEPEPIKSKYSYSRPTNNCPRVYCVRDSDPLVAGEYWEDISNFVQDQVPRYLKGAIDYSKYEQCRFPPPDPTDSPTKAEEVCDACEAGDVTGGTFKCGNDIYVCPEINSICATQGSQNSKIYRINQIQCEQMREVGIGDKCLALPGQGIDSPKALSNRVCYYEDEVLGMKRDGDGCDICNEYEELPPVDPTESPVESPGSSTDCAGQIIVTKDTTKLDLYNSELKTNTLHLDGGELRYGNIGIVRDRPVDLVVTVTSGDYTDIHQVWLDRGKDPLTKNGKNGAFGNINLQTVKNKPQSGQGNFKFCFRDAETDELTKVDTFRWSVFDFDERGSDTKDKGIGLKEKMLMDVNQAALYQLMGDTEVQLSCEDGSTVIPCPVGVRTVFHSSTMGTGADNPSDPNKMTDQQKARSVTFTFQNTDCWEFTYDHYCPLDQDPDKVFPLGYDPDNNTNKGNKNYDTSHCRGYDGGNFLFSGDADEIIEEGECITPPPTEKPTGVPTASPTEEPTAAPTTAEPTKEPTPEPTTADPTHEPTATPTLEPTPGPTETPTLEPTPGPTNSPTTEAPTAEPTGTPTTDYPTYDSDDSDDETDEPTLEPTRAPIADAGQGECPEDVKLIETHGSTMLPDDFVKAVDYNRETVTVRLTNTLSTETNLDAVYAYYQANTFDKECFSWHNVRPDVRTAVSDLEIQCTVTKPYALLQICIQDDALTKPILSEEDDAIIPQCCYAPPDAPPGTVCHLYEINCVSECLETDTDEVEVPGDKYGRPSVYSTGRRLRGGITSA